MKYLRSITIEAVTGPAASDAELAHLEGQRYIVGLIERRIKHAEKVDKKMDEADNVEVAEATEAPVSARPEWLPEKFETPEAMAKSYGELESWKGKREDDLRSEIIAQMEQEAFQAALLQLVIILCLKL